MSTEAKSPNVPVNPAKGNLQGQTTLAAKIDRWGALNNNLATRLDLLPQFRDQITQFQGVLAQLQTLRDRLKVLKGDSDEAIRQRDVLFGEGEELFTRLSLALRAVHGPDSSRLHDFGLKPRKKAGGRPRKKPVPTPTPAPPPVEIHTSPPVPGGTQEAHGAAAAPRGDSGQE
jgi:hypothetical protein